LLRLLTAVLGTKRRCSNRSRSCRESGELRTTDFRLPGHRRHQGRPRTLLPRYDSVTIDQCAVQQGLSLAPKSAHEISSGFRRGKAPRLSGPSLHAVEVVGLHRCIARIERRVGSRRIRPPAPPAAPEKSAACRTKCVPVRCCDGTARRSSSPSSGVRRDTAITPRGHSVIGPPEG
jgi:hypothetical protein